MTTVEKPLHRPEQSAWDDVQGRFPDPTEAAPDTTVLHDDLTLLPICRRLLDMRAGGARGLALQSEWRKLATTVAMIEERRNVEA